MNYARYMLFIEFHRQSKIQFHCSVYHCSIQLKLFHISTCTISSLHLNILLRIKHLKNLQFVSVQNVLLYINNMSTHKTQLSGVELEYICPGPMVPRLQFHGARTPIKRKLGKAFVVNKKNNPLFLAVFLFRISNDKIL